MVAEKSMVLHERIDCLIRHSVKEKVLAYLNRVAKEQRSYTIKLHLNRNELAQYLNVERSALSRELSRMMDDGIIEYKKNMFKIQN